MVCDNLCNSLSLYCNQKHNTMKKAVIAEFTLMTRIIVDGSKNTETDIARLAKPKILDKVNNGELGDNLVDWYDDEEVPYGTLDTDVYYQPDFGDDDTLITPNGTELWSYYVYSSLTKAKEDFPDRKILAYSGNDIENPYFIK